MPAIDTWIDAQSWPTDLKARAKMTAHARSARHLDPMTEVEWHAWALRFGGATT